MHAASKSLTCCLFAVLAGVLSGCGSDPLQGQAVTFACDEGRRFTAIFLDGTQQVALDFDGSQVLLPRVESDSGERYRNDEYRFWTDRQVAAVLIDDGSSYVNCSSAGA